MAPTHREPAADGSRRGTVRWVIAALALAALSAFPITMSVTALSASHTLRRTLDDRAMFDAVGTMVTQMNVELLRFQRAGSADAAKRFSSAADASTSSLRDIESTGGPQARTDARRLSTEHAAYVAHADQVFQLQAGSAELAEAQSAVAADFEILAQDLGTVLLEHSSQAQEQADDLGNTQLGLVAAALVTLIVAIGMTLLVLLAGPARRRAGPEASVSTEAAARSSVDPLTELPDEAAFEEHLQAALIEALQTGGRGVTVLSVSLVGFQQVEQTHGREGCQQLLVAASRRLRRVVRDVDIVGRLGDSGFCVLLRDMTNRPDVQAVTNRIDHVLSRDFRILSGIVSIKISIGIAIGPPDSDPKDIMRRSSTAMHRAETVGGGMAFAERKTGHGILTPVSPALGHELQDLLERGDPTGSLTVEYQPVVRLADGVTTSVEALASWQHPTYGSITAEELARLADASGLATHLATRVVGIAAAQAAAWQAARTPLTISVDITAQCLGDPRFADAVLAGVERSGCPPSLLGLELPEADVMANAELATSVFDALRHHGIRATLDHYGVIASSLPRLQRLRFDEVKLDHSLTRDLGVSKSQQTMVFNIIEMLHAVGLTVGAVRIRDGSTLALLHQFGCEHAQGLVLSAPVPPGDMRTAMDRAQRQTLGAIMRAGTT